MEIKYSGDVSILPDANYDQTLFDHCDTTFGKHYRIRYYLDSKRTQVIFPDGSSLSAQLYEPMAEIYDALDACPKSVLLWFIDVVNFLIRNRRFNDEPLPDHFKFMGLQGEYIIYKSKEGDIAIQFPTETISFRGDNLKSVEEEILSRENGQLMKFLIEVQQGLIKPDLI